MILLAQITTAAAAVACTLLLGAQPDIGPANAAVAGVVGLAAVAVIEWLEGCKA